MNALDHLDHERLLALLDRRRAAPQVAAHVAACETCRLRLDELRDMGAALRALCRPASDPSLCERVLAAARRAALAALGARLRELVDAFLGPAVPDGARFAEAARSARVLARRLRGLGTALDLGPLPGRAPDGRDAPTLARLLLARCEALEGPTAWSRATRRRLDAVAAGRAGGRA